MSLATTLTENLYKSGCISLDEKEMIYYGLAHIETNMQGLFLTLSVGVLFNKFFISLVLWLLMFPLRKNAGGFHAETKRRCFIVSALTLVCVFSFWDIIKWNKTLLCFSILLSWIIVYCMAPVECLNKPLEIIEERIYKKRTRTILMLEGALVPCAYVFNLTDVLQGLSMSCSIVAISLIAGRIKLNIVNKTSEKN